MAVTSGFFNALNKDRMYNSEQMSTLFDGIIRDGIFASIGTCLVVEASTGLNVIVGIGKAWFNHTWTLNDARLPVTADLSDVLFDRVDAVVLEVNNTESVRDNTIKFIKGTPSSTPILPDLIETEHVHQHVLAYVYRPANSTVITAVNITNMVGSVQTPFITGVLDVISVDELLGQWRAELDLFIDTEEADFTTWYNGMKSTMEDVAAELNIWTAAQQAEILAWFDDMKDQLSTDAAANLQLQINELEGVVGNSLFRGTPGDVTPTAPSNADRLGNQPPDYYAKQSDLNQIITSLNADIANLQWYVDNGFLPMLGVVETNPASATVNGATMNTLSLLYDRNYGVGIYGATDGTFTLVETFTNSLYFDKLIVFPSTGGSGSGVGNVTVYGSNDNSIWTQISTAKAVNVITYQQPAQIQNNAVEIQITNKTTKYKYLKIYMTGPVYTGVAEVWAFGKQ